MKTCYYCGEPSEDYEYINGRKVPLCLKRECRRELRRDGEAYDAELRQKAEYDNYQRYH